jgi:hypothetical protein
LGIGAVECEDGQRIRVGIKRREFRWYRRETAEDEGRRREGGRLEEASIPLVVPDLLSVLSRASDYSRGIRGQAATGNNKLTLVSFFYSDRADPDEFMLVMVVTPVASLTVPVAVMFMMPVFVIPVVIAAILLSHGWQRHPSDGSKHRKS